MIKRDDDELWVDSLDHLRDESAPAEQGCEDLDAARLTDAALDGALRSLGLAERDGDAFVARLVDRLEAIDERPETELPSSMDATRRPALRRAAWALALAACVLVLAVWSVSQQAPVGAPAPILARLDPEGEVEWGGAGAPASQLEAGPLELISGRAALRFANGASVTIEGPARVELVGKEEVLLERGRLRARVPEHEDFVVNTPMSRVAERASDFDVLVASDQDTTVRVRSGKVAFDAARSSSRPGRRRWSLGERFARFRQLSRDGVTASLALGDKGRFFGVLRTGDQEREFSDRSAFEAACRSLAPKIADHFERAFDFELPALPSFPDGPWIDLRGSLDFGDEAKKRFGNRDELERILRGATSRMRRGRALRGRMRIDGKDLKLDGFDAFERLREKLDERRRPKAERGDF